MRLPPLLTRPLPPRRRLILLLVVLLGALPAQAQRTLSDEAQISLITLWPADPVYTMFGHSALRVYDPATGYDALFNYGTFDFGNPLVFVGRFSYGKLDYFLNVESFDAVLRYWRRHGRPIVEQVLNLSPAQRSALFAFLQTNYLPENRYYRYDFFFDNCSTRIRDALKTVLADAVAFAPTPDPGLSFRQLIDLYSVEQPFVDFGMDLGLGLPADRLATPREVMFLPLYLMEAFDHATNTLGGQQQPLVARTDTLIWSAEAATLDPAWPWPSLVLWGLFALGLIVTIRDLQAGRTARRLFDGLLFGTVGVAGLLIVFLWFIALHTVTHWNLNLLWAWPTHLLVAVVLVRQTRPRWLRGYLLAAGLVTLLLAAAFFVLPQTLPVAVLPLLLLLAARCTARVKPQVQNVKT